MSQSTADSSFQLFLVTNAASSLPKLPPFVSKLPVRYSKTERPGRVA